MNLFTGLFGNARQRHSVIQAAMRALLESLGTLLAVYVEIASYDALLLLLILVSDVQSCWVCYFWIRDY